MERLQWQLQLKGVVGFCWPTHQRARLGDWQRARQGPLGSGEIEAKCLCSLWPPQVIWRSYGIRTSQ